MVAPADFKPDEDSVAALIARVPILVDGSGGTTRNCFAGSVEAYTRGSMPNQAVFVSASGGLPSKQLKGCFLGSTNERNPTLNVTVRSSGAGVAAAFQTGQTLAREVFDALHHNPPSAAYCESESLNSQPSYLGRDDDGHHEWMIFIQIIVDVVTP
jgi:hypothetical protein